MRQANILDPGFIYVPSDRTNVTLTWRRFGFEVSNNGGRTDVALTWRRFGFNVGKAGNSRSVSHRTATESSSVEFGTYHETQPGERSDTSPNSLGKPACC